MGTTLTGTTPANTYDSLIKVTDNGPLSGTAKYLSDGLGNDSAIALSTSNVGIGTNNPSELLELSATTDPKIRFLDVGNVDAKVGIVGSTALGFEVNGSERMRITSAGNVGIGTSNPTAKLHILNGETIVGSSTDGVKISYSAGNSSGIIDTAFSDNNLELRTNGTTKMWIANGGNVGIGTATPNSKLDIIQTSNAEAFRVEGAAGGFAFLVDGGTSYKTIMRNASIGNSYGGTAAPSNGLIVEGNVGIGTTSPSRNLEVSASSASVAVVGTSSSVAKLELISGGVVNWSLRANQNAASDFTLYQDSTERLLFSSSGYLRLASGTNGILFNGDNAAANALDDYEEGTWTANLLGGITNPTTAATTTGTYTKIGRQVTLNFRFDNKNLAGCTGGLYVAGCPFTAGGSYKFTGSLSTYSVDFSGKTSESLHLPSGSTDMYLYASGSNSGWAAMTSSTTVYVQGTITYFV